MTAVESLLSWFQEYPGLFGAFILVACSICLFWRSGKTLPPGPRPWPFLGTYPQVAKIGGDKLHLFYSLLHEKYGAVATMYFGKYPLVLISGYESVNDVFVNQREDVVCRPDFIPGIKTSKHLRTGIPFGNGTPWAESRKTMLSAVSVLLKSTTHENLVLEEVKKLVKDFTNKEGVGFQPKEHLIQASAAWHLGSAFGERYNREDTAYNSFLKLFLDILHNDGAFSPFGTVPLLKYIPYINKSYKSYVAGYNGMDCLLKSEQEERKSCCNENRIECLLDVFIREQRKQEERVTLTDYCIAVNICDYLTGGISAVAYTIDWALLYMVAHPHIQRKCQQEIHQVCGNRGLVKFLHTERMPYVRATIYETQRIASVVPTSIPYRAMKDITVRGYTIPKGTILVGHLASVHKDNTQWTDPNKFNPDRFVDTDGKLVKKPTGFMPFGNGSRFCPGYSTAENDIILVFANLLHSLEFRSSGKVDFNGKYTTGVHPLCNEIIAKQRK